MFDETHYENPFDAVDWRWKRVEMLCTADKRPVQGTDDRWIFRGAKFLRDLRGTKDPLERYEVTLKHRELAEAFSWYTSTTHKRQFMEALTLCEDLTQEDQADYLGLSEKTVETYERLFFDVRDKRGDKGFICTKVLEPSVVNELHDAKNPIYAWKLCAVFGGFSAVKACWEYREHPAEVNNFHKQAGISQMFKNFGLAQYFRPVNRFSAAEVTDHLLRVMELEVKAADPGAQDAVAYRADVMRELMTAGGFWLTDPDDTYTDAREPRLKEVVATVAQDDGRDMARSIMQTPVLADLKRNGRGD